MDVQMLLDEGIDLFNRRYFFEAHDVWEEIWQKERGHLREFFKGLIHLAGGFHHYTNGNYRGSAALLGSGLGYLRPYVPGQMGVDLAVILPEVEAQRERIVRLRDGLSEVENVTFPTLTRRL
jgi:predicted metal-dependent hydrolase